jgi:hypothetical protein
MIDPTYTNQLGFKSYLFFIFLFCFAANAQKTFTISGIITDDTGEPLIGATLFTQDKSRGVVSNEYGFYSLSLEEGMHSLVFSFLGFLEQEKTVTLTRDVSLNISLQTEAERLNEVVLVASDQQNRARTPLAGVSKIKAGDVKSLPSLLGEADVNRYILTTPGITSVGEGTSGFNVRGGGIDQNLIIIDETPLYNSSHLWGFFSIINPDAIKNMELYKGGIPARFGGRGSSVLDIRLKEGNNKKISGEAGIGMLFSRLTLSGPIKKDKLNFMVSARRSYFDLFFPLLGDEVENSKAYFYDLSTKLSWKINPKNTLYASGYFGADVMKLSFDADEDLTQNNNNNSNTASADEKIDFRWKNATATLRWNHLFSNKLFLNMTTGFSRYNYVLRSENDPGGGPAGTSGSFTWNSSITNWIIKPDFTLYVNPETKLRFGVHAISHEFAPAKITNTDEGINNIKLPIEKGLEIAPYASLNQKWNRFSMALGVRYSWFGNIGPATVYYYNKTQPKASNSVINSKNVKKGDLIKQFGGIEPRLALNYKLSEKEDLKLGIDRNLQYIHLVSNTTGALPFDTWKPAGEHIDPLDVRQISLGYHKTGGIGYTVETFYKTFDKQVEYKDGADLFINKQIETELLPASGFAYGVELGLTKDTGKLTGRLNYTFSRSKRKTTSIHKSENINNGAFYSSNFDRPHVGNLSLNYPLSKRLSIQTFFTYQTGRPITQAIGRFTLGSKEYIQYSDRNAYRLPNVHRMDISFILKSKNKKRRTKSGNWTFGVYNIYGRANALTRFSNFFNGELRTFDFSPVGSPIPFISKNIRF